MEGIETSEMWDGGYGVFVQSIWSRCIVLIMVELETWKKWVNQGGGYGIINR